MFSDSMTPPSTLCPVGVLTTAATLGRDLESSLSVTAVQQVIEGHQLAAGKLAAWLARTTVALSDGPSVDAATWRAAEALYQALEVPQGERQHLRAQPLRFRVFYLSVAANVVRGFRASLEGLDGPARTQQAYTDLERHKADLLARRASMTEVK